jgi:hypothetical protein
MAFSATVHRLLISCPGDVPASDLRAVQKAINRWNVIYGPGFASSVILIAWGTHAAAEFGRHPQEAINDQLVDNCDICIAIFANRIGTPTNVAESGTAEEIERLHNAGCYVGILRRRGMVDSSSIDHDQAQKLETYLDDLKIRSLFQNYTTEGELEQHIDTILTYAISRDRAKIDSQLGSEVSGSTPGPVPIGAEVWPRVESSESVRSSSKGRARTSHKWYLVLANTGPEPARNVRFDIEAQGDGAPWTVLTDTDEGEPQAEIIPPNGGDIRFVISATFGIAGQVRCTVQWEDSRGVQVHTVTLRLT